MYNNDKNILGYEKAINHILSLRDIEKLKEEGYCFHNNEIKNNKILLTKEYINSKDGLKHVKFISIDLRNGTFSSYKSVYSNNGEIENYPFYMSSNLTSVVLDILKTIVSINNAIREELKRAHSNKNKKSFEREVSWTEQ